MKGIEFMLACKEYGKLSGRLSPYFCAYIFEFSNFNLGLGPHIKHGKASNLSDEL